MMNWKGTPRTLWDVVLGWAALVAISSVVVYVGGFEIWSSHHACPFIWGIAGTGSGLAIAYLGKASKWAVLLYAASILLYAVGIHGLPKQGSPWHWVDWAVLIAGILVGGLLRRPVRSAAIEGVPA